MKANRNLLISLHHGSPSENRTCGQVHRKPVDTDRPEGGGLFAILRLTILVRLGGRRRDLSQPNPDVWGILDRMAFLGALFGFSISLLFGLGHSETDFSGLKISGQ